MTCGELYRRAVKRLSQAQIPMPSQEAALLSRHFLGMDRGALAVKGDREAPEEACVGFLRALGEREGGRPLQYILGEWDFMGLTLRVGEGVLIPREDTAVLVEAAAKALKGKKSPRGADLCCGSGAAALGICSLVPEASVKCVELSEEAIVYLKENLRAYENFDTQLIRGDVLKGPDPEIFENNSLDFIISNPPYIRSGEIDALQREVQREPKMALDGGEDGLMFYRALVKLWLPLLKRGGVLAVETGEDQGDQVKKLFEESGVSDVKTEKDMNGLDRAVWGIFSG